MLNYQKDKILELNPKSMVVDYQLLAGKSKQEVMSILHALQTLNLPLQVAIAGQSIDRESESIIKSLGIPLVSHDKAIEDGEKDSLKDSLKEPNPVEIVESNTACAALAHI